MTTSSTREYLSMSIMDREIIRNREPPDRGRMVAKWIMSNMLARNKRSKVIYIYIIDTYIIDTVPIYGLDCEYTFYVLSCMYGAEENVRSNIINTVPIYGLDCEGTSYALSCIYGAEENLQFARKLSASLDEGGQQHEGIFVIYDINKGCRRVFDLKYHPPERICLREYGLKPTCISQVCDGDVDISRQKSHLGTLAECPGSPEQTAVQPEDNSDQLVHLALRNCHISPDIQQVQQIVVKDKVHIRTKGYEALRRFIPPKSRKTSPLEMFRCEKWLKENKRFNARWEQFLEHWFDRHQPDDDSNKSGGFQIDGVVYNLEHKFPYIFAVLVFNVLCKYGKCTKGLVKYVRELLNSGPNLDVITEKENSANGKVSEDFIKHCVKPKREIWTDSFRFEDQLHLGTFLREVKLLFEQNIESDALRYFKQSWAELIDYASLPPPPQSQPRPDEFVDFVRIGNGIFG